MDPVQAPVRDEFVEDRCASARELVHAMPVKGLGSPLQRHVVGKSSSRVWRDSGALPVRRIDELAGPAGRFRVHVINIDLSIPLQKYLGVFAGQRGSML